MQRLKTRPQFQAVLAGSTIVRTTHFALHRSEVDTGEAWIGAMVPKRWAKRAVTRNTIKRQIYAVSKTFEPTLPVAAHVVRLRSAFDRALFLSAASKALKAAVRQELHQLFSHPATATLAPPARQVMSE